MNRPELVISLEEARKRISLQLRRGRVIQESTIKSKKELDVAESKWSLWYDYTKNLLESIDSNLILVEQFHYLSPSIASGIPTLAEKTHTFRHKVTKKLDDLQSIYDGLDLLSYTKTSKKPANYNRPRKLSSAQEKICWDNNPHVCNLCGKKITRISEVEFDHAKAFVDGGNTDLQNVKLSHRACNKQKGAKSLKDARKMLGYYRNITSSKKKTNPKNNVISKSESTPNKKSYDIEIPPFASQYIDNPYVNPREYTTSKDQPVVWQNNDDVPHSITSGRRKKISKDNDVEEGTPDGFFDKILSPHGNFEFKFDKEGIYHYYCKLHKCSEATIIVK